ncbi:hypothetical protein DFH07DRAFT_849238 [Mycena maculata]|uniref:Uncharacterized protein n=1 Tax=Mycena maculata TaxID=230809 RepID=A0AAD7HYL4_9AGAR|nr:hypothetical protein DFH07DRAFT_849238 [Mycena maculata]
MFLLNASPEVLHTIVLHAAGGTPHGPLRVWYNLVLCCQTLRRQLDTPAMHARLFAAAFHVPADVQHLLPAHAKRELARRFSALNFFRRGGACLDDAHFTDALWVAYVMLKAEEPRRMNVEQLVWAGLPELLLLFLKRRLNDGAEENHGWPLCNETNSLVLALMWLLSSESSVRAETPATRDEVMERIRPYVLAAFRYPLSSVQDWYFGANTCQTSPKGKSVHSLPGIPPSREVAYFGTRTVQVPSAPIYSILCYFTRLDTLVPMFPAHLATAAPVPRVGPRRADVEHFINACCTRFEPWDFAAAADEPEESESESPARAAIGRSYAPGALTGRWNGSSIVPCINEYRHWLDGPQAPADMNTFCRHPLYVTLQEHYFCSAAAPAPGNGCAKELRDDVCFNPSSWEARDGGIEVFDESESVTRFYETRTGIDRPEDIVDVIVTGQTDDPYATAWGAFNIFGRVQLSDGLIVLRRESITGLGTTLLRGYMSSSQNFAGRYRAVEAGCEAAAAEWEAPFSLCKVEAVRINRVE